jgi:hypothetical protein
VQSLNHLVTSLNGHESEAGGNTQTPDPWGSLPSTASEQSSDIDKSYAHGDPDLEVPSAHDFPNVHQGADAYAPSTYEFSADPTCTQGFGA